MNNKAISPILGVVLMVAITISIATFANYYFTSMLPSTNNPSSNWVHNLTENPLNNPFNNDQIQPIQPKDNTIPGQNQNWTKNNTIPNP
jgi:flagellin-like protein